MKLAATLIIAIVTSTYGLRSNSENFRPIIGVLSSPNIFPSQGNQEENSYILGSDVQFLWSGGSRVTPIPWNIPPVNLTFILNSVNGVMIPGGPYGEWNSEVFDGYTSVVEQILTYINKENSEGIYYPLIAIGSGFEILASIISNSEVLVNVENSFSNRELMIQPYSKTYSFYPEYLSTYVGTTAVSNFNNEEGVSIGAFQENGPLSDLFNVAATSIDGLGVEFISALEGINAPIYMLQYRPQANLFDYGNANIEHDYLAQFAATMVANFLVNETRANTNTFPSASIEDQNLIYNTNFTFINMTYPRVYFFNVEY